MKIALYHDNHPIKEETLEMRKERLLRPDGQVLTSKKFSTMIEESAAWIECDSDETQAFVRSILGCGSRILLAE